jgi:nicotinamide mononucleotide transporter
MNWLDPLGAGLSLICTYYFTNAKRMAWLIGMAAIILNSILYWQKGIYGHLLLESIYFITMIYGFMKWSNKKPEHSTAIRLLTLKEAAMLTIVAIVGVAVFAQILMHYTNSDIPYWDALTTTLSLIAQWMLCLKIIHCWIVWFIVDALVAALQLYKGIPFHSAIHFLYLGMAVMGYYRWHKLYKQKIYQLIPANSY